MKRNKGKSTIFGVSFIPVTLIILVIVALICYDSSTNSFKMFNWEYNMNHIYEPKGLETDTIQESNVSLPDISNDKEIVPLTKTENDMQLFKDTIVINDSIIYIKKIIN